MKKKILLATLFLFTIPLASCGGNSGGGGDEPFDEEKAKNLVLACKDKSIASTYKYNYTVSATLGLPFSLDVLGAKISGDILYNRTQYLQKRVNSGPLLIDSTTYTFNRGNDLIKIDTKNDDFEVVNKESFSPSYDFESNSVGKLFKLLVKDEILEIKDDKSNPHKFSVSLGHTSFKNKFLSILNFIDLTAILNYLNKVTEEKWDTTFKPSCCFVLNDQNTYVKDFYLDLNLDFKGIVEVTFSLEQHFSQVGETFDVKIPDVLEGCVLTSSAIDSNLAPLKTSFESSKEHYYKYYLKTGVDHGIAKGNPLGLAVNSTSKGYAERKEQDGKVYFHNELELDSDYKNDDQYPDDIEDYKYTRAKVTSDQYSVYDVYNPLVGFKQYHEVNPYDNDLVDDYYMMPKTEWLSSTYINALRRSTKNNKTTWKLGLSSDAIKEILNTYNKSIRLDADGKKWIDVYEIDGNFNAKNFAFVITTDDTSDNRIVDINIEGKGTYTMKTNELYNEKEDVKFSFELKIDGFNYTKDYSIPEKKENIDC